jgi:hypothetical protein
MRSLTLLLAAALLGGCEGEPAKPRATRKDRMEAAEVTLARTPVPRTYRYADGELRVLQVPVADGFGFVERQTCLVWRDLELRTSSISCSAPGDVGTPVPVN